MDFHGNNVHHIGYGHPRLKRAITEQMDALTFAPRRYACDVGGAAGREAGRDRAGRALRRSCSPPADRTRSRSPSSWPAPRPAGSRRCPSGTRSTAPASAPPRCRGKRCSAPARRRRWSPARSTSRPSPATAAPTAIRSMKTGSRCSTAAISPARRWWSTCSPARATSPRSIAEPARAVPYLAPPGLLAERAGSLRRGTAPC